MRMQRWQDDSRRQAQGNVPRSGGILSALKYGHKRGERRKVDGQVFADAYKHARRIVITIVGGSVLLLGLVLIFLPGPAIIVIPAGLAILGLEFAWARRWLRKAKKKAQEAAAWYRDNDNPPKS